MLKNNFLKRLIFIRHIATGCAEKIFPKPRRLALNFFALILLICAFSDQVFAQIQIVNCDAQLQSRKRGIAVNTMSAADFRALAPGVSWYYNWGATPLTVPGDVTMDFIPMAWNGASSFQTQLSSYLAAGNRPWRVFAINEPNLSTPAGMSRSQRAFIVESVKALCDPDIRPLMWTHLA